MTTDAARSYATSNAEAIMRQLLFGATREEVRAAIETGLELAFDMGALHADAAHEAAATDQASYTRGWDAGVAWAMTGAPPS